MLDPITVSVLTHRFEAIVQEMGEAMLRTAYSQILNSSRDFSTAICDAGTALRPGRARADPRGGDPVGGGVGARRLPGARAPGRRLPSERHLPRQQPPAGPHRVRPGLCRRRGGVLV